jgi:hypothetical protein
MMDHEASVSAIVIHHPEARNIVITPGDIEALERAASA